MNFDINITYDDGILYIEPAIGSGSGCKYQVSNSKAISNAICNYIEMYCEKVDLHIKPQITEWCSHCENEVTMEWDVEQDGYKAFCPFCGKMLMLCDECSHHSNNSGNCKFDNEENTCRMTVVK